MSAKPIDSNVTLPLDFVSQSTPAQHPRVLEHKASFGDTLVIIARKHGVPYNELLELNIRYNLETLLVPNPGLIQNLLGDTNEAKEALATIENQIHVNEHQTILIPAYPRHCSLPQTEGITIGEVTSSCGTEEGEHHNDRVLAYSQSFAMSAYTNHSDNQDLADVLEGLARKQVHDHIEAGDEPVEQALSQFTWALVNPLYEDARELECDHMNEEDPCHGQRLDLRQTADDRAEWLRFNWDFFHDDKGWFRPDEIEVMMDACVALFSDPQ